jgi:hypothetical protein
VLLLRSEAEILLEAHLTGLDGSILLGSLGLGFGGIAVASFIASSGYVYRFFLGGQLKNFFVDDGSGLCISHDVM